ncbi:MAG TPA: alpha/beta fold hydrolase [Mycobacteriales bacterium]|nr:alpha/beta fold hydrolase [Mycobacteriales bacterium]
MLFIHGATASGTFEWARLADALSAEHRCVLPDLRGHGHSPMPPEPITTEAICADLRALCAELAVEHPHVVGFSFGAETALWLELTDPGFARSLTLISPGTGRPADYRMPSITWMEKGWPPRLRALHEEVHGPEHWRVLLRALQDDSATRSELPVERLASVRCPVLLVSGENDEPTRRTQAHRFADANAGARLAVVAEASHPVHHERPTAVHALVGEFLADVDRRGADDGSR